MNALAPEKLHEFLRYDRDTGKLFWKARKPSAFTPTSTRTAEHVCANWNARYAGKQAFTASSGNGYKTGAILGRKYYAHRVAWAIAHGSWPKDEIDHINGDPCDNRIDNLREATREQNERNKGVRRNNTSGYKGVSLHSQLKKWVATITVSGAQKYLGVFDTPVDAYAAYCAAASELHQEYVRKQ